MKRLIETIVLALLLIDPGGPSRHPAFAQDRDYVTEGEGVLDPKHGLFLFEEETKVISYSMSEERASQFALAINSTTQLKTLKGLLTPSTILLDCKSGRLRLTAHHQPPDSATDNTWSLEWEKRPGINSAHPTNISSSMRTGERDFFNSSTTCKLDGSHGAPRCLHLRGSEDFDCMTLRAGLRT